MAQRHRVELVRYSTDRDMECWASPNGSVILMRRRGEDVWRALLDRYEVVDAERLNGAVAFEPKDLHEAAMVGTTPQGLARNLALQEMVHVLFDA